MKSFKNINKKFYSKSNLWRSISDNEQLHELNINGETLYFDGYGFTDEFGKIKKVQYHDGGRFFVPNTKFKLISVVEVCNGFNYLGYNQEKDIYVTFQEDQIYFK